MAESYNVSLYIFSFLFFIAASYGIAHFLGKKRQIGFKLSFLFCLTLSPLVGFLITMTSSKYYLDNPKPSLIKRIIGWLLAIPAILGILGSLSSNSFLELIPLVGVASLAGYLIKLGKGERFDDDLVKIGWKGIKEAETPNTLKKDNVKEIILTHCVFFSFFKT